MATILIVDDSAFMRMRCVATVKELGHETIEAGDGQEAIDIYKEQKPQAVLLDITMPNTDGLTALREILAIDPDAKVAMVTAMGQQGMVMEAIKVGAKDFVVKPFEPARIKAALEKLVA
jgi:two-component system chemotaxis response regulator CheY